MRARLQLVLDLAVGFWVIWTLYAVGRFGGAVLVDPSTTGRIMGFRDGERIYSAIGLTYHGLGGVILVLLELIVVLAALLLSQRPSSPHGCSGEPGSVRLRRVRALSHLVLVFWSALWLGNSLWMESLSGDAVQAGTVLSLVATVLTIARGLVRRGGQYVAMTESARF